MIGKRVSFIDWLAPHPERFGIIAFLNGGGGQRSYVVHVAGYGFIGIHCTEITGIEE